MAAYIVIDADVHDAPGLAEYGRLVPTTVAKHGGRFIVRGGSFQVLEGSWQPKRVVLLEFPSTEQARRWYDSEEYRPLKAMRLKASTANMVLVDGV